MTLALAIAAVGVYTAAIGGAIWTIALDVHAIRKIKEHEETEFQEYIAQQNKGHRP